MFFSRRQNAYRSALLDALGWLDHGFGTRHAVTAPAPAAATLKQVHSDRVWCAGRQSTGCLGEGDALITRESGLRLEIRTADCVPVLLADRSRRAVAAIHAGWRGTAAAVVRKTVERMREEFGCVPDDLVAAIGPAIGACCYEVGPEVAGQLSPWMPEPERSLARGKVDLEEANRRQLLEAGVPGRQIARAGLCTRCIEADFHSWRRDRERAGRMLSWIAIT